MNKLYVAVACASSLMALPATAAMVTGTANFSGYQFNTVGSATLVGTGLQLTTATPYVKGDRFVAGAAWLTSALSTTKSFSASFDFSLSTPGNYMADGIALVLQNKGTSVVGWEGSYLGYQNLNGVGSLIQTWSNNNVGLNTSGIADAGSTKDAPTGLTLKTADRITGTETVSYNATTQQLAMTGTLWVTDTTTSWVNHLPVYTTTTKEYAVSDSAFVDLEKKFGSSIYLGFTGATGSVVADQRITGFSVSAVPEPETYALFAAGLGVLAAVARRRSGRTAR